MRKALIGIAVATALFAVGAFAASFAVQSEDIASGSNPVSACADRVDVDFVTVYDGAGDWTVTGVELTFYDGPIATAVATADCAGFGANVAVMTSADGLGAPAAKAVGTVGATAASTTIALVPATLKASAVTSAAVLVDGKALQTATPGEGL